MDIIVTDSKNRAFSCILDPVKRNSVWLKYCELADNLSLSYRGASYVPRIVHFEGKQVDIVMPDISLFKNPEAVLTSNGQMRFKCNNIAHEMPPEHFGIISTYMISVRHMINPDYLSMLPMVQRLNQLGKYLFTPEHYQQFFVLPSYNGTYHYTSFNHIKDALEQSNAI